MWHSSIQFVSLYGFKCCLVHEKATGRARGGMHQEPEARGPAPSSSHSGTGSGSRTTSGPSTRDTSQELSYAGAAPGRASSALRSGPAAPPVVSSTRAPPPGAMAGGDTTASMGRGASRGREQRDVQIYTRPSAEFVKLGKFLAKYFQLQAFFSFLCITRKNRKPYSRDF